MLSRVMLRKLADSLKQNPVEDSQAAVAIMLTAAKNDLELFIVKRADVPIDPWSGDMAFPGGKRVTHDRTLLETVTREVYEETSIDLSEQEVLGYMNSYNSWVRKEMTVQPVVYLFKEKPAYRLNYELTKAIWVPLGELVKTRRESKVKGFDTPVYTYNDDVIWGLTYRMIEALHSMIKG